MSTTSSRLPVCVHCGTARPADETLCPTCGKPWIDTTITGELQVDVPDTAVEQVDVPDTVVEDNEITDEIPIIPVVPIPTDGTTSDVGSEDSDDADSERDAAQQDDSDIASGDSIDDDPHETEEIDETPPVPDAAPPAAVAGKVDDFSFDDWTEEPESSRRIIVWLLPVLIGAVAAAVWLLIFLDGSSAPVTTTVAAAPTTTATSSTVPDTTTTSASTPTTTTPLPVSPPPDAWPPTGDPLDVSELPLKASGIGPLDLGAPIADVAGVLTASFGTADAAGTDDVCKPDESYWLQWGDLRAIFDGQDPDATFVSFRNETTEHSDTILGISTLSGLAVGDTVEDLINTYPSYTVSFEVIDSVSHFRLVQGGELLLWGPVTSSELDGIVEGIYSPSPCPT